MSLWRKRSIIKYGIVDDEGHVIRWTWDRPGPGYEFVEAKVRRERKKKPRIDWANFEPAPF